MALISHRLVLFVLLFFTIRHSFNSCYHKAEAIIRVVMPLHIQERRNERIYTEFIKMLLFFFKYNTYNQVFIQFGFSQNKISIVHK